MTNIRTLHLYRVRMSMAGVFFMVAAADEAEAARAAETRWRDWDYRSRGGEALAVELAGFGGQFPPSNTPYFLIAGGVPE